MESFKVDLAAAFIGNYCKFLMKSLILGFLYQMVFYYDLSDSKEVLD